MFCIVLTVIAATAYLAHDIRVRVDVYEQAFRVAQELSSKRWKEVFKLNPELVVPPHFYDEQKLFEHVEEEVARVAKENASQP